MGAVENSYMRRRDKNEDEEKKCKEEIGGENKNMTEAKPRKVWVDGYLRRKKKGSKDNRVRVKGHYRKK